MRLRQAVLASTTLDSTVETLCEIFSIRVCYRDPGVAVFGLENALMPVGDTFLEVVSPTRVGTTAGRYLERHGDGGYMLILQLPRAAELEATRQRLERSGVRIVWEGERDGTRGMHLHPRDVGGAILSLDHSDPAESWAWAGSSWETAVDRSAVEGIVAAEIAAAQPEVMAARWAEVLDRPALQSADHWAIELDGGALRFAPLQEDGAEGLRAIDLACVDHEGVEARARIRGVRVRNGVVPLGGVSFRLV